MSDLEQTRVAARIGAVQLHEFVLHRLDAKPLDPDDTSGKFAEFHFQNMIRHISALELALVEQRQRLQRDADEARAKNKELNRRCQAAESAVMEKVQEHPGRSLGRALANAGYGIAIRERDEACAELAAVQGRRCKGCFHNQYPRICNGRRLTWAQWDSDKSMTSSEVQIGACDLWQAKEADHD